MTKDGSQTYDANAGFWIEIIRNHRDKYRGKHSALPRCVIFYGVV